MKLPRAIRDRQGKTLKTRKDAAQYVLDKLAARPDYRTWKHAAELLLDKESSPETITGRLSLRC